MCRKMQHVERGSMEALPNLICGKFAVGRKDNLPPDTDTQVQLLHLTLGIK